MGVPRPTSLHRVSETRFLAGFRQDIRSAVHRWRWRSVCVTSVGDFLTSILIVDPELAFATPLARDLTVARPGSSLDAHRLDVKVVADFSSARARLRSKPLALLVTALQLGEYHGLHLVHLAAAAGLPTRSLVYTDIVDPFQAREVRAAGAFYELRARLPVALSAYVGARLPPQDRRETLTFDRGHMARAGRRAADRQGML